MSSSISNWKADRLPDLTGRTYLITGANSGIGFEAAVHLRAKNADVLVGARSPEKGSAAITELQARPGNGTVDLIPLDLASLDSVAGAAAAVREHTDGLDAIVNNAGIMQTPQLETADGFELQFGTNHLGHVMLNHLLFDLVVARSGRIVPVSSIAHLQADGINVDDPMHRENYSPTRVYAHSKLANIVYGLELARRLEAAGSPVMSVTCHPGYSATNLQSTGPTGLFKAFYRFSNTVMAQSPVAGALPEALAAAGTDAVNGAYYGPTSFGGMRGPVGDSRIASAAKDEAAGEALWALTDELLGITFDVSAA